MISLSLLKKNLNIDQSFTDDDALLVHIIEVAEEAVKKDLDLEDEKDMYDEYDNYKPSVLHAIMLFAGNLYNNREATNTLNIHEVPLSYHYLVQQNKKYL